MKVHRFEIENRKYFFDVNSCSFFQVDDLSYRIIPSYLAGEDFKRFQNQYNDIFKSDWNAVIGEFEELKNNNQILTKMPHIKVLDKMNSLATLVLTLTKKCNLKCEYCYQSQESATMEFDTAKQAIDFFVENSGDKRKLFVKFFGGEPLLEYDLIDQIVEYDLIDQIVEYCESKNKEKNGLWK